MPASPPTAEVVVLGARGLVGPPLLRRLERAGAAGLCLGRTPIAVPGGFAWAPLDTRPPPGAVVLSLLPLWLLPPLLERLEDAVQVVALGSTSVHAKSDSPDPRERRLAAELAAAERALAGSGVPWTVLRPTLIWDMATDANVAAIARVIRRFRCFPVAHPAAGLRQPIHADDVAAAMLAAIANPRALNRAFDLPGGETLCYREMVRRIGVTVLGRDPPIVPLPAGLLAFALSLSGSRYSPALVARMNQDLAFDGGPARAALGIAPRPFQP